MNIVSRIASPLLTLSLLFPPSIFAQPSIEAQLRNSERSATQAMNQMQRAGTEFYLDAAKTKAVDLRDLSLNKKGTVKVYAVAPYDAELKTRVGIAESMKISNNGKLTLTIEILKNESKGLVSYPVRAIKTVTFADQDAATAKIKYTQTIKAALEIAKNQLELSKKSPNMVEKFASKMGEIFFPSANASAFGITGGIIAGLASAVLLLVGGKLVAEGRDNGGGFINISALFTLLGVLLIVGGVGLGILSYQSFRK